MKKYTKEDAIKRMMALKETLDPKVHDETRKTLSRLIVDLMEGNFPYVTPRNHVYWAEHTWCFRDYNRLGIIHDLDK